MEKKDFFAQNRVFLLVLAVFFLVFAPYPAAGGEAVLIRGNYWVNGISGFGSNGFPALAGEYRLQAAGTVSQIRHLEGDKARFLSGEGDFTVHVTREALYFSREWQTRPGITNIPVLQRMGEEGFFVAATMDNGPGASWVAIFRFKRGLEGAGINGEDFNRMLRDWMSRLSYFLSNSRTPTDISLPAALVF